MSSPELQAFREKHPEYNAWSDREVAEALYDGHYSHDWEESAFMQRLGVEQIEAPEPEPEEKGIWDYVQSAFSSKEEPKLEGPSDLDLALALDDSASGFGREPATPDRGPGPLGFNLLRKSLRDYLANRTMAAADSAVADYHEALQAGVSAEGDPAIALEGDGALELKRRTAVKALKRAFATRQRVAAMNAGIRPSEVTEELLMAPTLFGDQGAIGKLADAPFTVMTEVTAQSLPNMIDSVALAVAGSLAGPKGTIAGFGLGSAMSEYRASLVEGFAEAGFNLSDPEQFIEAYADKELVRRIHDKAWLRAGVIGTFDAASAGVAGRALPLAKHAVANQVLNAPVQMGIQGALGAAGEAGAQLATEGRVERPGEVVAEFVGEMGSGFVEGGLAGLRKTQEVAAGVIEGPPVEEMYAELEAAAAEAAEMFPEAAETPAPPPDPVPAEPMDEAAVEDEVVELTDADLEPIGDELEAEAIPEGPPQADIDAELFRLAELGAQSDRHADKVASLTDAELAGAARQSLALREAMETAGVPNEGLVEISSVPGMNYRDTAEGVPASSSDPNMFAVASVPIDQLFTEQEHLYLTDAPLEARLLTRERPVLTQQSDGKFHIDDGNHRVAIAALLGQETVEAEVYAGPGHRAWLSEPWAPPQARSIGEGGVEAVYLAPVQDFRTALGEEAASSVMAAVERALSQPGVEVQSKPNGNFVLRAPDAESLAAAEALAQAVLSQTEVRTVGGVLGGVRLARADSQAQIQEMRTKAKVREVQDERIDLEAGPNAVPTIGLEGSLPVDADQNRVLANGRTVRIPEQPIQRRHVMARLARHFGLGIYEGKVRGPRSRLGFYRRKHGEIRIRNGNDIEVLAHEFGHWMAERFPWVETLYPRFREELSGISYDSTVDEGFAEYMRLFFTQEEQAVARAPNFDTHFRRSLEANASKEDVATIYDVQEMMHAWLAQGARARAADKGSPTPLTFMQKVGLLIPRRVRQRLFDGLAGVSKAEMDIVGSEAAGVYKRMRLAYGGYNGAVEAAYYYGTPGFRQDGTGLELTGEGLREIFGNWWGSEELGRYMIARRAQELSARGLNEQFREDEIAEGLSLEQQHPEFATIFDRYQRFNQRMLDFAQQGGVLSEDARIAIEEANRNYLPFYRVIESFMDGRRKEARPHGNPYRRITGGTADLNNVWENIITNTGLVARAALVNDAKRSLFQMIERADNQQGALYAAPVDPGRRSVDVPTDRVVAVMLQEFGMSQVEYAKALEGMGTPEQRAAAEAIDKMRAGVGDIIQVWSGAVDPQGDIDFYMDNGEKRFFEIADPDLWDSLNFMRPHTVDGALQILAGFTRTLRRGVTATPAFQFTNFGRDTTQAWLAGKNQIPAIGAVRAAVSHFTTMVDEARSTAPSAASRDYALMLVNGGGFATRAQGLQPYGQTIVDPRGWLNFYDRLMSGGENANRLAEFRRRLELGESPRDAAFESREISTDFALRGSSATIRNLAMMIPFFNARLQGFYVMTRKMGPGSDVRTSLALKGAGLAMASVLLYLLTKDDDRIKEAPEDVKDRFWLIPFGDREDDIAAIPKPFEFGFLFGSVPMRLAQFAEERDGRLMSDSLMWMLQQSLHMDMTPQVVKPWYDLAMNRNFAGAPIVPFYLEGVEPSEQFTHYTSISMREFGRQLGVSPLQSEYLVRGYLGTMGTYALAASDALWRNAGVDYGEGEAPSRGETWRDSIVVKGLTGNMFNEGPRRRTKSQKELYSMARDIEQASRTFARKQDRNASDLSEWMARPENAAYLAAAPALRKFKKGLRQVRDTMDRTRVDPTLTADQKRDTLWNLTRQRNRYVAQASEALRSMGVWETQ